MQRISSSIASALGGGLKDVMMQALGLGDAVKASGAGNPAAAESPVDKPNLAANPAEGSKASTTSGADDKSGRILKAAGEFSNSVGLLLAKDFAKEWIQKGYKKSPAKKTTLKTGNVPAYVFVNAVAAGEIPVEGTPAGEGVPMPKEVEEEESEAIVKPGPDQE